MAVHEIERTFPKPNNIEQIMDGVQSGIQENNTQLSALEDRVNVNENDINNIATYVETVSNGVYIGDRNDPQHRVRITKQEIDFLNGSTVTASVTGNQMDIPTVNVVYLKFNEKFIMEYMENGMLVFKER